MNIFLKSTAARVVGRGYLSSDHISTATGLDPAITISKNGGNFANPAAGASVMTEIESTGWYYFALGADDVDTLGPLIIRATHATMDNIEVACQVVETVTAANVAQISGSATAADNLEASALTIVVGAAAAGTLSTTQMTTNLTEATNDHYNGRMIIWTSGVLINQATAITDYDGSTKMLTYTAVTEAPTAGDTFIIV